MRQTELGQPISRAGRLSTSAAWNLLGYLVPIIVALASVPTLVHGLGSARFGVLSLAWVLIGSFSLFDLGLGRALTQLVASALGRGEVRGLGPLVWTSLLAMLAFGAVGTVAISASSPWLIHSWLRLPPSLQSESLMSFYLLAVAVPVVMVTSGLRGVLEAQQRFGLSNLVRIPLGVFTFAGPLLALPFTKSIAVVVLILLLGRIIAAGAYLVLCLWCTPFLGRQFRPRFSEVGQLLRQGAWMSISNFISPIMVYTDRFVIASLISVAAVAYYALPYDVVLRILVIPGAIAAVMFPAFASSFIHDPARTTALFVRGAKYLFLLLFPLALLTVTFAGDGLRVWLGADFARHSTVVLKWLVVGVFFNGLAQMPFTLIQGVGRSDLTAKLHLAELPIYLSLLWWLIAHAGIEGAAMTWALRSLVDMVLLFALSVRILGGRRGLAARMAGLLGAAIALFIAAALLRFDFTLKALLVALVLAGFLLGAWFLLLSEEERQTTARLVHKSA